MCVCTRFCACACMNVCMYVHMHTCICERVFDTDEYICIYRGKNSHTFAFQRLCPDECMHAFMHVRRYVYMHLYE